MFTNIAPNGAAAAVACRQAIVCQHSHRCRQQLQQEESVESNAPACQRVRNCCVAATCLMYRYTCTQFCHRIVCCSVLTCCRLAGSLRRLLVLYCGDGWMHLHACIRCLHACTKSKGSTIVLCWPCVCFPPISRSLLCLCSRRLPPDWTTVAGLPAASYAGVLGLWCAWCVFSAHVLLVFCCFVLRAVALLV